MCKTYNCKSRLKCTSRTSAVSCELCEIETVVETSKLIMDVFLFFCNLRGCDASIALAIYLVHATYVFRVCVFVSPSRWGTYNETQDQHVTLSPRPPPASSSKFARRRVITSNKANRTLSRGVECSTQTPITGGYS